MMKRSIRWAILHGWMDDVLLEIAEAVLDRHDDLLGVPRGGNITDEELITLITCRRKEGTLSPAVIAALVDQESR